ncbi:MAG TPA: hypothetical protein DIU39_02565 [Flavobacteriales bacterium]|nr:hypothetical protein [Flavobacteriales bacterium]
MNFAKKIFFLFILFFSFSVKAQKDTLLSIPFYKVSYAFSMPGLELANRFGNFSNGEMGFSLKHRNNWIAGVKGNFMWSNQVKEDSILQGLYSGAGIIGIEGNLTDPLLEMRGWAVYLEGGYQLPWFKANKNSGFTATASVGLISHKIRITYRNAAIPLLDDKDFLKGYDRKSMGFAAKGFFGYYYFSKKRLINFFGGVEYTYASVKNIRKYNYDTKSYDSGSHQNSILGFRIGWILLLNKRPAEEFYYY